jgi:glycosyltransferase involved in cell wall biosynthesis
LGGNGHSRLLKILHIDPERNWGGGETQVFGLLGYLAEKGHRNDLLAHPEGRLFEQSRRLDVKTLPLVVRNDLDLRPMPALRRLILAEQYDVVHLHTKRAHALSLWLPRGANNSKYIVTRRMDYPESDGWYTRHLYNRRVDGVVAISQGIRDLLVKAGVDSDRVRLIHSGVEPRRFESCLEASAAHGVEPIVGTVAVLEKRKGHDFLFQAAARLKAQGFKPKIFLAGDGSLRAQLEQAAENLGLKDAVRFFGFVSDPAQFLSKIDIFVLPSLYEGLGVAALEAMAAGKPVVATRAGGLTELVLDSVTGFLVPPRDSEALAAALAKLLRDKPLAQRMGQRGAERVRERFTLERMAAQNEAYYYELLEGAA